MSLIQNEPDIDHVAGFSLLGSLGKRVLRPGGAEMTQWLLRELAITADDDVVEIAPGRGHTAQQILERNPATYVAVDHDDAAGESMRPLVAAPNREFRLASVSRTGLDDAAFSVAVGEAVLTMHPNSAKAQIMAELARIVRPGGRLGLHEVALYSEFPHGDPQHGRDDGETSHPHHDSDHTAAGAHHDSDHTAAGVDGERISDELTSHFKVSFHAMSLQEWEDMLAANGFVLRKVHREPLRLLEPGRVIADEGMWGAIRFGWRVVTNREIRQRVTRMRAAMRRNSPHLRAVGMVAERVG